MVIHHWSASHSTPGSTLPARHLKPQSTRSRLEEVFCWNLQTKFHPRALFWSLQQDGNKGVVVFSSLSSSTVLFLVFGVVWPLKIPCSPNYSVIPWFMSCFCSLLHSGLRRKITQWGELFLPLYSRDVVLYKRFSMAILIPLGISGWPECRQSVLRRVSLLLYWNISYRRTQTHGEIIPIFFKGSFLWDQTASLPAITQPSGSKDLLPNLNCPALGSVLLRGVFCRQQDGEGCMNRSVLRPALGTCLLPQSWNMWFV